MNSTNFTPHVMVKDDFFAAMYSNTSINQLMFCIEIIVATIVLLLMSGIIWYEKYGNHRCRTPINQLFSTLAWVVINYVILVYLPEGIRYLKGPLDESFCYFHNFMKNFLTNCFLLGLDLIIVLRYIFIFKLSNFAVVNDDLIARFLNLSIVLLSLWLSVVKKTSTGLMPVNYHMCAGSNPNENEKKAIVNHGIGKFNTTGITVCVSFLLHGFILTKIFMYEWKMEKKTQNINLGTLQNSEGSNTRQRKVAWSNENKFERLPNLAKSMIDFTTQLLCLLLLVLAAIMNYIKNATQPHEATDVKNWWYGNSEQTAVTIAMIGISLLFYGRNKHISKSIWKRVQDIFRNS